MFLTYLRRELRRRMRQAIFIALGLALGIGLVITVTAASSGVSSSQGTVLHSLYGVGTDVTVTQTPPRIRRPHPVRLRRRQFGQQAFRGHELQPQRTDQRRAGRAAVLRRDENFWPEGCVRDGGRAHPDRPETVRHDQRLRIRRRLGLRLRIGRQVLDQEQQLQRDRG